MKISIAMATYNGEKYLQEQLDSFLCQTRLPDELIVSDDCSIDRTVQIVKEFSMNAPFQVVLNQNPRNLGYAGNFNKALELTAGDIVFLSDQDDVWFPQKIAVIVSKAERYPEALAIMNDSELTDGNLQTVGLTKLGQLRAGGFSNKSFVMGCCAAVRRSLLDFALPVPEGYASHDKWLLEIADALNTKLIFDEVLQYYRRHGSNESQAIFNQTKAISRRDVFKQWISEMIERNDFQKTAKSLSQLSIYISALKLVISKADVYHRAKLKSHLIERINYLSLRQQRQIIRNSPFSLRFSQAINLWHSRKYHKIYKIKSILRDLLG